MGREMLRHRRLLGRLRFWNEGPSLLRPDNGLRSFGFQLLEKRGEIRIAVDSCSYPLQMLNGIRVTSLVYQQFGERQMRERVIRCNLDHSFKEGGREGRMSEPPIRLSEI